MGPDPRLLLRSRGSRPLDLPLQTLSSCPTLREGEALMCPKKAGTRTARMWLIILTHQN